jgi:hypothetical protein
MREWVKGEQGLGQDMRLLTRAPGRPCSFEVEAMKTYLIYFPRLHCPVSYVHLDSGKLPTSERWNEQCGGEAALLKEKMGYLNILPPGMVKFCVLTGLGHKLSCI